MNSQTLAPDLGLGALDVDKLAPDHDAQVLDHSPRPV